MCPSSKVNTLEVETSEKVAPAQPQSIYNVYKSHDSGISSNGFYNSPNSKMVAQQPQRGEGDGSEELYHHTNTLPKLYEKYPLEPPELPPRDYTTDEDNLEGTFYIL